jgi:hypothetical protein
MSDFSILCWNVRGLNLQARRDAVRVMISTTTCHLACLQETKLSTVDRSIVMALGGPKLNKFSLNLRKEIVEPGVVFFYFGIATYSNCPILLSENSTYPQMSLLRIVVLPST